MVEGDYGTRVIGEFIILTCGIGGMLFISFPQNWKIVPIGGNILGMYINKKDIEGDLARYVKPEYREALRIAIATYLLLEG